MADSKQPDSGGDLTVAQTATPTPGIAVTVRQDSSAGATPQASTAFRGAMGTGGMGSPPPTSIKAQNLLDDKLILSAARAEVNGQLVPVLGGIHLLAKLGQGGMGAVYFGIHPRLHQEVAVKVLPFHLAEQQPGLVPRFIREAQIAAKVRSPHLVGVIDVNEENGLFFLVMEFVSGKSAGDYLRTIAAGTKGLPEKTALAVCIGAAEGLAAAHAHGVIHRDIKPDNIMIPRAFISSSGLDGVAQNPQTDEAGFEFFDSKLADLGLARNETGDQSMTGANVCMGTPGFMSPEQAQDAKHASKTADVFSLGATLYALLTGDSPFKGTSLMHTLNLTVNEPHLPIAALRSDVSAKTSQLLDRSLAKKPEDRYPDANSMLLALRESLDELNGVVRSGRDTAAMAPQTHIQPDSKAPTVVSLAGQSPKSNWLPVVAAIAFLVLAAGGVGGYFLWQKMARDEKEAQLALAKEQAALEAHKMDDMREAAFQEELRMIDSWNANQRYSDTEKRAHSLESALKAAGDFRRNRDWEHAISTLETGMKDFGDGPSPLRHQAIKLLNDVKDDRAQAMAAFGVALQNAADANRDQNWDKTIQILENAFLALGTQPHTERIQAGEYMLKSAREQKRNSLDSFATAYKAAQVFKRDKNADRTIATLENALKTLGGQPHSDRAAAESLLKDAKDERDRANRKDSLALDALPAALITAQEYKRVHNWDGVVVALEEPLKAIGSQQHPNRAVVEALLKEAKDQKERQRLFKLEIEKGNDLIKAQNYEQAKTVFEGARKMGQDASEIALAIEGVKRVAEGSKRVKSTQAHLYMTQGRNLRPDYKNSHNADWAKAGEAFKNAAVLFSETDEKEDLARADVEQGDCLRKDNNKNGDWNQAIALYESAALIYASLGERKFQAEAVAKHAACLDPELNPTGSTRMAAPLYGRAAMLFGEAGNKRAMADNLSRQGSMISKEKALISSMERAADAFRRAAAIYEEIGEKKAQGLCLFNEAACMIKGKKVNMSPEARALFQRAAKVSREAGDEATVKMAEDLLK